jgi:membrane associated rhomboid family serine protease
MLLPISHEKMTVRRMPVVTIGLVVVTVLAFVVVSVAGGGLTERLGYVPERGNVLGLVTYMFAHADVWHVAGNMWFLFLCGLSLEDRWGRLPFAIYYLVAGVVAAGVHHLATSEPAASLIGASGAVAGAMGAFLVLFATTKIRFVGFLGFRLASFEAPAYVMLPLWAVVELLYGLALGSTGTAHWAHVGGFAFGVLAAGAFRAFGVDRRLDDAVERAAVLGNDPRVDAARALVANGEADQAVALLEGLAKEKPESTHVQEALRQAQRASTSTAAAPVASAPASPAAAPFFPAPAPARPRD